MLEWMFSVLFSCESGINQYVGQKTLTDVSGANLLLLQLSCFRNIVLSYFENASYSPSEITCLLFCSVLCKKTKIKRVAVHCSLFPRPVIGNLPHSKQ